MSLTIAIKKLIQDHNPQVHAINLREQGIEDDDLPELVSLLQANPYITTIDLSRNNIGDKSATLLSQLQRDIHHLNVSFTDIGDEGLLRLGQCENIRGLDLSFCAITNQGAEQLLQVEGTPSKTILLGGNRLNPELLKEVNRRYALSQGSLLSTTTKKNKTGLRPGGLFSSPLAAQVTCSVRSENETLHEIKQKVTSLSPAAFKILLDWMEHLNTQSVKEARSFIAE